MGSSSSKAASPAATSPPNPATSQANPSPPQTTTAAPAPTASSSPSSEPVTITYTVDNVSRTETFDYLVIACDPRQLPFTDRTSLETEVNQALTSYTFRTSLYRATRPDLPQLPTSGEDERENVPNYCVRFNPAPLARLDGALYGFRDEVMARDPDYNPSPNNVTWITSYQLEGRPLIDRDPVQAAVEFDKKRDAVVNDPTANRWIDFVPENSAQQQPEVAEIVDYFPHYEAADLQREYPWRVRDAQGLNSTVYVSAFTCFESVLHIYLYEEELMKPDGIVMEERFPKDKNASFAIIGAGPSGILFASQHLQTKGYTNFKILEKDNHFGGKTMTHRRPAPANPDVSVPCELGTCYLSLGYEPMFHLFPEFDAGAVVQLDRDGFPFRSVIDDEVANNDEERENGVEYGAWTLRKNGRFQLIERIEMLLAGIRYLVVHYATMGMTMNDCMPANPPTETSVIENLSSLVGLADEEGEDHEDHVHEIRARDAYNVLRNEKRDKDDSALAPRGLFAIMDGLDDMIPDNLDAWFKVEDLEKACKSVFNTPYGQFLDENNMDELKSVFIYGYQVQGYGTIEQIPAYYGMLWMTPAVLTGNIRLIFNQDPAADSMGTVNVITEGWLTLWEKMVERDMKDKIVFNANVTRIDRVMSA